MPWQCQSNRVQGVIKCKKLTHGGNHVGCCTLMIREPEGGKLGGGKNDEGLTQGAERLTQHDNSVPNSRRFPGQSSTDAHQRTDHGQPGTQNELQTRGMDPGI